jgi:hypothetical protein
VVAESVLAAMTLLLVTPLLALSSAIVLLMAVFAPGPERLG